jgi:cytochrome c5
MKLVKTLFTALLLSSIGLPFIAQADDGNWKRGRIYYRMVCTTCHVDQAGGAISPATMTIAEWKAYIEADQHAKGKDKVSYYVSKAYRESIKDDNKAAAKFIKLADEDLLADIKAFVIHGAKDSDSPARCN